MGGHLTLKTLVATSKNCSHKWLSPVPHIFFVSQGCPLMRASTLFVAIDNIPSFCILDPWKARKTSETAKVSHLLGQARSTD